jgi:hypothetical protein
VPSAAIELSMFVSHGIWYLRTRSIRLKAKDAGIAFEEFPELVQWQECGMIATLIRARADKKARKDGEGISRDAKTISTDVELQERPQVI